MYFLLYFLLITGFLLNELQSAPAQLDKRKSKQLYYDDYLQSQNDDDDDEYHNELDLNNDYVDDNDLSRTIQQGRRRLKPNHHQFESPIYYIRLPPQPYVFVPGLGYISQPPPPPPPPQSPVGEFLNLPVNFLSNGKPSTIYQWSGGVNFQTEAPPPPPPVQQRPVTPQRPDSTIHRLPGKYTFNGKPEDMFILRDSYNSLYSDALTNFYP